MDALGIFSMVSIFTGILDTEISYRTAMVIPFIAISYTLITGIYLSAAVYN